VKDLLTTADLSADDLAYLLRRSVKFKAKPHGRPNVLSGETVCLYFSKPSTRTRISFETAVVRLGGVPIFLNATDLQLGRGETLEDTARVVSRYARAFVIRTFKDEDVARVAAAASIPVVNALTDGHHPCQSVADLMTLAEHKGPLNRLKIAYLGDGNNVAVSLMQAAVLAGTSIAEALRDADAVYCDVWLSMGHSDAERTQRHATLSPYQVNAKAMRLAKRDAIFLHCLPAHRGEEVTAEVADGPQSVIFDQAENRLWSSMAILYGLLENKLEGARRVRD
jgi:ornithine carbamoyltransferase